MSVLGTTTLDGAEPPNYLKLRDDRFRHPSAPNLIASGEIVRRVGRGADLFDASPDASAASGWSGAEPTRYRFVCRGRRHRLGRVLDRVVRVERLLELCRDALRTPGPAEVVLF